MKILSIKIPTVEDVINLPAYKRKNTTPYCINTQATLNPGFLAYIDNNGLVCMSGKKYENDGVRLIIDIQKEENEQLGVGDVVEYNGYPFEIINDNQAISLQNITIENLLEPVYSASDPNRANDVLSGYNVNKAALANWFEKSNKTLKPISEAKYVSEEHYTIEKELFKEIIKYTYASLKEINQRLYDEESAEKWNLTEAKMNDELERPNTFVANYIGYFMEAINNELDLESCALYFLKSKHLLGFNDDLGNLTEEKSQLLNNEIERIRNIYSLAIKYRDLNKNYENHLSSITPSIQSTVAM